MPKSGDRLDFVIDCTVAKLRDERFGQASHSTSPCQAIQTNDARSLQRGEGHEDEVPGGALVLHYSIRTEPDGNSCTFAMGSTAVKAKFYDP